MINPPSFTWGVGFVSLKGMTVKESYIWDKKRHYRDRLINLDKINEIEQQDQDQDQDQELPDT